MMNLHVVASALAGLSLIRVGCATSSDVSSTDQLVIQRGETNITYGIHEVANLHNKLGALLFLIGDLTRASEELRTAIRLDPESPAPHNNLGMVLHAQGNYVGAIGEFSTAVRLSPNNAVTKSNLGFALFEHGELESAIVQWQTAVSQDASIASAWAGLGLGCFSSGSVDKGLQNYRQAIRLDSSYGDVNYLRLIRRWNGGLLRGAVAIMHLLETRQTISAETAVSE
ncbi:MAG: tetratricopeptide repeat protein [Nitrospira sp.]|nr:tetratricopeptide repeat protein [Nitrospira sp.]